MFHFSSNIQEQQASVQQDSQFKKRPDISGTFLERRVLRLVRGVFWFSF